MVCLYPPDAIMYLAILEYVGKRANEVTAISNFGETAWSEGRTGPTAEMIKPRISQRGAEAVAAALLFIFVSGGGLAGSKQQL